MYADRSFTSKVGVKSVNEQLVGGGGVGKPRLALYCLVTFDA